MPPPTCSKMIVRLRPPPYIAQMVAAALQVIANCVTAPPSLGPLLALAGPPAAVPASQQQQQQQGVLPGPSAPGAGAGGGSAAGRPLGRPPGGAAGADGAGPSASATPAPAGGALVPSFSAAATGGGPGAAAAGPSYAVGLAQGLEAGFSYARQCLRANSGIRALMQLLQPRGAGGPGGGGMGGAAGRTPMFAPQHLAHAPAATLGRIRGERPRHRQPLRPSSFVPFVLCPLCSYI
jgi:hypothetical protein